MTLEHTKDLTLLLVLWNPLRQILTGSCCHLKTLPLSLATQIPNSLLDRLGKKDRMLPCERLQSTMESLTLPSKVLKGKKGHVKDNYWTLIQKTNRGHHCGRKWIITGRSVARRSLHKQWENFTTVDPHLGQAKRNYLMKASQ